MDFIEELRKINEENISLTSIIDNLYEQDDIISKKIHVFKIMKLAKEMFKLSNSELSKLHKIDGIRITRHDQSIYFFHLFDKDNEIFESGEVYEQFKIVESLMNFNQNNISKSMERTTILFNENFEKNFINIFLNEELRNTLAYSEMQLELSDKKEPTKKLKV